MIISESPTNTLLIKAYDSNNNILGTFAKVDSVILNGQTLTLDTFKETGLIYHLSLPNGTSQVIVDNCEDNTKIAYIERTTGISEIYAEYTPNLKKLYNIPYMYEITAGAPAVMEELVGVPDILLCSDNPTLSKVDIGENAFTNTSMAFYGCTNLSSVKINMSNVTRTAMMFSVADGINDYNSSLTNIEFINANKITDARGIFMGISSLSKLPQIDFSTVIRAGYMFMYMPSINDSITISNPNMAVNDFPAELNAPEFLFNDVASNPDCQLTINYKAGCKELAEAMVASKDSTSNVVLGTLIS